MAIAVSDELQKSGGLGTNRALTAVRGRSVAGRGSSCKPSRERMCLGAMSEGVGGARWTQIDAIARADMPWSAVWRGWRRSMDSNRCHRASGCALEGPGRPIRVPGELQESEGPCSNQALRAVRGSSVSGRDSSCKPSREPMCLGAMSGGVRGARWTQIDAIARVNVPWRALEGRLPCQMNCRNVRDWAPTGL